MTPAGAGRPLGSTRKVEPTRRSRRTVSGSSCLPAGQQRTGRWDAAGLIGGQAGLRSARSASWLAGVRPALGAGTRPRVRAASAPAWVSTSSGSCSSSPCCSSRAAESAAEVLQLRLGQRLPASGASGRLKLDKLILGPSWRLRAGRGKREMAQSIGWRREQGASCGCTSASCSPRDGIPGARRRRGERAERAERVSPDEADFSLYPSSRVSRPLPPGKIIIKRK